MTNQQQAEILKLILNEYTNLFPGRTCPTEHLETALAEILAERKQQKKALFDAAWDMHTRWIVSFGIRQREAGGRFDEGYKQMQEDDREANRKFTDLMHAIVNPHLAPLGLSKSQPSNEPD